MWRLKSKMRAEEDFKQVGEKTKERSDKYRERNQLEQSSTFTKRFFK